MLSSKCCEQATRGFGFALFAPFAVTIIRQTKKPAAGGAAAGFSKITEQRLGGEVSLFPQMPLGRRNGTSETRSSAGGGASHQ